MPKNKLDTFKNYLGYDGKKVNEAKALFHPRCHGMLITYLGKIPERERRDS